MVTSSMSMFFDTDKGAAVTGKQKNKERITANIKERILFIKIQPPLKYRKLLV